MKNKGIYTAHELSVLLSELQVFKMELEMQNEQLKKSHEQLENERAKLSGFFNFAPVGYFILDPTGIVAEANQTAAELLKYKREELLEKRFQSFIPAENWENFYQFLHQITQSRVKQNTELPLLLKTGTTMFTRMEGVAIKNAFTDKLQYYITVIDITESREAQLRLAKIDQEKQRSVMAAIFSTQENEREKISSALHDSVCQLLYGIKMNLYIVASKNNLKGDLENVNILLEQAIKETRELSYELVPSILRDFGIRTAVTEMAERLSNPIFSIRTHMEQGIEEEIPKDMQLSLYRILQEAINNCIKHSHATKAEIVFYLSGKALMMSVRDNGKGFGISIEQALKLGSGLRGIKNRAELLGSEIKIDTSPKGTHLTLNLNLNDQDITGGRS